MNKYLKEERLEGKAEGNTEGDAKRFIKSIQSAMSFGMTLEEALQLLNETMDNYNNALKLVAGC